MRTMTRTEVARILQGVGVLALVLGAVTLFFACWLEETMADARTFLRGGGSLAGVGAVLLVIRARLRPKTSEHPVEL